MERERERVTAYANDTAQLADRTKSSRGKRKQSESRDAARYDLRVSDLKTTLAVVATHTFHFSLNKQHFSFPPCVRLIINRKPFSVCLLLYTLLLSPSTSVKLQCWIWPILAPKWKKIHPFARYFFFSYLPTWTQPANTLRYVDDRALCRRYKFLDQGKVNVRLLKIYDDKFLWGEGDFVKSNYFEEMWRISRNYYYYYYYSTRIDCPASRFDRRASKIVQFQGLTFEPINKIIMQEIAAPSLRKEEEAPVYYIYYALGEWRKIWRERERERNLPHFRWKPPDSSAKFHHESEHWFLPPAPTARSRFCLMFWNTLYITLCDLKYVILRKVKYYCNEM